MPKSFSLFLSVEPRLSLFFLRDTCLTKCLFRAFPRETSGSKERSLNESSRPLTNKKAPYSEASSVPSDQPSNVVMEAQPLVVSKPVIPVKCRLVPLGKKRIPKTVPVERGHPFILGPKVVGRHQV